MTGADIVNITFTIGVVVIVVAAIISAGITRRAEIRAANRDQAERRPS